ncbi:MAG: metallophosphoesterase [Armatimonadetes bacterium]|nr:metallophosphoesterase [Armatimonadota bacterium]MDE2205341.1 metallophosphoesterase [Armatimonadota bacterium]
MIRRIAAICAVCVLASATAQAQTAPLAPIPTSPRMHLGRPPTTGDYWFVVGGDNRAVARGAPMPPTAGEIFTEIRLIHPAFVLWSGDTIYGTEETVREARAEYRVFLQLASRCEAPVFVAPGNHEIARRPEMAALFQRMLGPLYGSFDWGATHVIALNTEGPAHPREVTGSQLKWLTNDLNAHASAAHTFVFMHHPLFPTDPAEGFKDLANRDALHQMFVRAGVHQVFSGHEHLYHASVHDGISYVISGGSGAPSDAAPEDGGFQHYLLVHVHGATVRWLVLQPWRLFAYPQPRSANGARSVLLANYNLADVPMVGELSTADIGRHYTVSAVSRYKGKVKTLPYTLAHPRIPGVIDVRVIVPGARPALITITPQRGGA